MSPRAIKQVIYGGFYLAILAGIGYLAYFIFLQPGASCTNGVKDRNEEGIDCGGVCGNVCLPSDLRPIMATNAAFFVPAPQKTSVLIKIQNANPDLAARTFDYTLNLYDGAGAEIKTMSGNDFIYAGEIKYFTQFFDGLTNVARAELLIKNPEWAKVTDFKKPEFLIQDRRIEVSSSSIQITGRLVNKDAVLMPKARITAIFYGGGGNPIGVSATELDDVAIEDVRPFSITHPVIPNLGFDPVKTELVVSARRP